MAPDPLGSSPSWRSPAKSQFPQQMPEDGSGSSLSPHLAVRQMLFIFTTVSSPLTKATEFLGSIKIMCHRVPWVKCMLLRKAFPLVYLLDEMFGDLQHLPFGRSPPLSAPLWPNALLLALVRLQGAYSLCSTLRSTIFWQLPTFPWVQWNVDILYPKCRMLGAKCRMLGGGTTASHGFIISWPRSWSQSPKIDSKCALQPIPSLHGY